MTWVKWLWGNEQWDGCGAPWDQNVVKCPICNAKNGTTVHKRPIQCPKWAPSFSKAWTQSWGTWAEYAEQWYTNASPEDMHHVACLRLPQEYGPHLRHSIPYIAFCLLSTGVALYACHLPGVNPGGTSPSVGSSFALHRVMYLLATSGMPTATSCCVIHSSSPDVCSSMRFAEVGALLRGASTSVVFPPIWHKTMT